MEDNVLDLDKDLEFEDFCDKKYVSQLTNEEIVEFSKSFFKFLNEGETYVEMNSDAWYGNGRVEVDDKYLGQNIGLFYVNSNTKQLNQWNLPNAIISYCDNCRVRDYDYEDNQTKPHTYINFETTRTRDFIYSDYTIKRPMWLFSAWSWEPAYFMYMYNKFGEEYCHSLLNMRKLYRAYWEARETAKRDDAIRLMEENVPPYKVKKLAKHTDTFIGSVPVELVKTFHERQVAQKPWVIDVTNFQTLKNEDIKEEQKDSLKRTVLRRIKYYEKDNYIESVEEYQWREPHQVYRRADNVFEYVYAKKNQPVRKNTYEFRDFDFKLNGSGWGNYETFSGWTGVMYAAFGEEYKQAYKKAFDDKITEYLNSYDAETIKIVDFMMHNCNFTPKLESVIETLSEEKHK